MTEFVPGSLLLGARCVGYFFAAPIIGERFVAPRLRLLLAVLIGLLLGPIRQAPEGDISGLILLELLFGLMAGFVGKVMLAGAEAGGQLIGLSMGLGFAGNFDPTLGEEALPTRRLLYCLAGIVFLSVDGLEITLHVLLVAPLTNMTSLFEVYQHGGEVLAAGLRVAAPVLISSVVVSIAAALVARASPSMNLLSLSLPILLLTGGAIFLIGVESILQEILLLVRLYVERLS
jgi:flagellar biosynthetic protein FliR